MTYHERQAVFAAESVDNGIFQLECFRHKAEAAIPVLQQMVRDLADGGLETRDVFRSCFFESLIKHLREVHPAID